MRVVRDSACEIACHRWEQPVEVDCGAVPVSVTVPVSAHIGIIIEESLLYIYEVDYVRRYSIYDRVPFFSYGREGNWTRGGGGVGGWGGAKGSFVACLSHLTIDHASLSTRSTVSTRNSDTSNTWVLFCSFLRSLSRVLYRFFVRERGGAGMI